YPIIYPPPPAAIFPIPLGSNIKNSLGILSLGLKRKRIVIDNSSNTGRSYTRVLSTSNFNNNIKAQYYKASPTDIYYIISSRDNTISDGYVLLYKHIRITRDIRELKGLGFLRKFEMIYNNYKMRIVKH
ncbi:hypothetical protein LHYA1_G009203, partial [Lachnellula hyalina]